MSGGWNTIESDAGRRHCGSDSLPDLSAGAVFTFLLESLGVRGVQFEELYTLEVNELDALEPVYGLIFLFRFPTDRPYIAPGAPLDGTWDHAAADERVFFATQTIQNACATQALLSVVLNQAQPGDGSLDIGQTLTEFRDFAMALPPELRGETLSNSELIRGAHNSFARADPFADETRRPLDNDEDAAAFHYVAYVPVDGVLYELDGLQPAPVSHGPCPVGRFSLRVAEVLRHRVARYDSAEIRFNLLAAVRDRRAVAREAGDVDALGRERARRRDWRFEDALRRHNFVAFAAETLRGVIGHKLAASDHPGGSNQYDAWVADGVRRRKETEEANRARTSRKDTTP